MNPFTRFLSRGQRDASLQAFIAAWDGLEALAIDVYKAGLASDEAERVFLALTEQLRALYAVWRKPLSEHWTETLVAGAPTATDPFAALLDMEDAADFVDNWAALQQLPAAREALNRLVVERSGQR
jgi:hypothetical protein